MLDRFSPDITRGDAKVAGALAPENVKKMISPEPKKDFSNFWFFDVGMVSTGNEGSLL
jgi:hypothetical protein